MDQQVNIHDCCTPGSAERRDFDIAVIGAGSAGFCFHRAAAICMQGQLVGRDGMFCHGVIEECFELNGTFRMLNTPADHAAAEK